MVKSAQWEGEFWWVNFGQRLHIYHVVEQLIARWACSNMTYPGHKLVLGDGPFSRQTALGVAWDLNYFEVCLLLYNVRTLSIEAQGRRVLAVTET